MHIRKYIFTHFKQNSNLKKKRDKTLDHLKLDVLKKLGVCLMQRFDRSISTTTTRRDDH